MPDGRGQPPGGPGGAFSTEQRQRLTDQGLPYGQASGHLLRPGLNSSFLQNSYEEGRTSKNLGIPHALKRQRVQ